MNHSRMPALMSPSTTNAMTSCQSLAPCSLSTKARITASSAYAAKTPSAMSQVLVDRFMCDSVSARAASAEARGFRLHVRAAGMQRDREVDEQPCGDDEHRPSGNGESRDPTIAFAADVRLRRTPRRRQVTGFAANTFDLFGELAKENGDVTALRCAVTTLEAQ